MSCGPHNIQVLSLAFSSWLRRSFQRSSSPPASCRILMLVAFRPLAPVESGTKLLPRLFQVAQASSLPSS